MIPGVTISLGGRDWVVPPLTLGQLRRLIPKIRKLTEIGVSMDEEHITILVEIIVTALKRNYPNDVTLETVEDMLDLGNARGILNAVLGGTGLRPTAPGEQVAGRTNGEISMASSPSVVDTLTQ